ncbi:MAG: hypothetical protein WD009_14150 [Phycisphaeraceae bacterium]
MTDSESLYRSLLPYLVGLSVATDTRGATGTWMNGVRRFVLSGCVFEYGDVWFLATAGHILSDFNAIIEAGGHLSIGLLDAWSAERLTAVPVPLHYDRRWAFGYDDDGIDFGLILLPNNTRSLLESSGVHAIGPEHHAYEPDDDAFERCAVLGIPSSSQTAYGAGDMVTLGVAPTLVQLEHRFEVPESVVKPGVPLWYGRFLRTDEPTFGGMDGMSGGPVFGLQAQDDGGVWFHVLGVQYAVKRRGGYTYVMVTPWAVVSRVLDEIRKYFQTDEKDHPQG